MGLLTYHKCINAIKKWLWGKFWIYWMNTTAGRVYHRWEHENIFAIMRECFESGYLKQPTCVDILLLALGGCLLPLLEEVWAWCVTLAFQMESFALGIVIASAKCFFRGSSLGCKACFGLRRWRGLRGAGPVFIAVQGCGWKTIHLLKLRWFRCGTSSNNMWTCSYVAQEYEIIYPM